MRNARSWMRQRAACILGRMGNTGPIVLWVSDTYPHGRDILRGALRFARHQGGWEIVRRPEGRRVPSAALVREARGIVAFINAAPVARAFAGARCPVVNVAASLPSSRWPVVANDDAGIGRMAAEHFLDRGYHNFAYVGLRGDFALSLEAGFAQRLARENRKYQRFTHGSAAAPSDRNLIRTTPEMVRWVRRLPASTAVFAVVDTVGAAVAAACRAARRDVPGEIAILGVNDDDLTCESTNPPLSSIETGGEQIGYRAAMLLADLMEGAPPTREPAWVPPRGVVMRASTDALGTADELVVRAVEFIRQNVARPTSVNDVLAAVMVSRKSLERRFGEQLGRTPLAEIRRVHIHAAKQLLIHTDYPMKQVARRAGFARPQHMATLFRRLVGVSPTAFRQRYLDV